MKFIILVILLALSGIVSAQISYVAPTKVLTKKGYQIGGGGDYFMTSRRVDKDGDKFSFQNGEGFSRIQGNVFGAYGLTDNFQISGGVRFRQNQFKIYNTSTADTESETSTGVESTYLTLMYAFKPIDKWYWAIEGTYRFRPYSNEESSGNNIGSLVLGDEGSEYSAGLGLTYAFPSSNFLTARGGYRNPGKNLAGELYWQVEGALAWRYVALVAGVDGVSSRNNDPYENDLQNRPAYNTGTTNLYMGINREYVAPYAGVNVALGKKWRVELRGTQVVKAASYDLGTGFGINLIRRVDTSNAGRFDRRFKDYDFEGSVTKVSPKKGYVVIDKGVADEVHKGTKIGLYEFDYVGGNLLLASGVVVKTTATTAIVKISHLYNTQKELKEGLVARGNFK